MLAVLTTTTSCGWFSRDAEESQEEVFNQDGTNADSTKVQTYEETQERLAIQGETPCDRWGNATPTNTPGDGMKWVCANGVWVAAKVQKSTQGDPTANTNPPPSNAPNVDDTMNDGTISSRVGRGEFAVQVGAFTTLPDAKTAIETYERDFPGIANYDNMRVAVPTKDELAQGVKYILFYTPRDKTFLTYQDALADWNQGYISSFRRRIYGRKGKPMIRNVTIYIADGRFTSFGR